MSSERSTWSRRDLFRMFRRPKRGAKRPKEPAFGPPSPSEVERERQAARALLGEVPAPASPSTDPSALWKRRRR
jgi:hypothetical protein